MKFLADMAISQSTSGWLRDKGHDVVHLAEAKFPRISDAEIIEKARAEGSIILTCDLDFGDIMAASGGRTSPSVIILRLENQKPENVNRRLGQVLEESFDVLQRGAIVSVEETRHRTRLLPI